jgi:hypothetical protein
VNKQSIEIVAARIAELEVQETRLVLTVQFPPPGCRSVEVWRRVQSQSLIDLRQSLNAQRENLAHLKRCQLVFEFGLKV